MGFKPSKYQSAIFAFGVNKLIYPSNINPSKPVNAVVDAKAGSGKTTTIIALLKKLLSEDRKLLVAFNKHIEKELSSRVENDKTLERVTVSTSHSLGFSSIRSHMGKTRVYVKSNKYKKMFDDKLPYWVDSVEKKKEKFKQGHTNGKYNLDDKEFDYMMNQLDKDIEFMSEYDYKKKILKMCSLFRLFMCENENDFNEVVSIYQLEPSKYSGDIANAIDLIEMGRKQLDTIDYDDMLYLPIYHNMRLPKYKWVIGDEAQDFNRCQKELLMRSVSKNGGRFIILGDINQAVYSFMGADDKSFESFIKMPNTIILPLSISYRCDKAIIREAQKYVPGIEAREDAGEGEFEPEDSLINVRPNDLILCRNNYPLSVLCNKYLQHGIKATIIGKSVGTELMNLIKKSRAKTVEDLNLWLKNHLENTIKWLVDNKKLSKKLAIEENHYINQEDKVLTLKAFAKGCTNIESIEEKINDVYQDEEKDGIILSSIHKSKGLEADRVFIIHRDMVPAKYAETPVEKIQENNLIYVAITRAKHYLGYIKDFSCYKNSSYKNMDFKDILEIYVEEGIIEKMEDEIRPKKIL